MTHRRTSRRGGELPGGLVLAAAATDRRRWWIRVFALVVPVIGMQRRGRHRAPARVVPAVTL